MNWIKQRIVSIFFGALAIMGIIISILRGNLNAMKAEKAQREADIAKASEKATEKATEALIKGIENEAKPISRGHFDRKSN